jgi:peroxiredoxin Q/BCP
MLSVGSRAPEIDAVDQQGRHFRLSDQSVRLCTVVYFFPKAFTPGCTRETAAFRDNYNELRLAGASLVGVSTDDSDTQCKFAQAMQAPFPLLADRSGEIAKAYDVRWPLVGLAQRVTYVIGPSRLILRRFHHEIRIGRHQDDVLHFVDELYRARSSQNQ